MGDVPSLGRSLRAGHVRRFFPEREIKTVEEAIEAALTRVTRGKGRQVLVAHQFVVARGSAPIRSESENASSRHGRRSRCLSLYRVRLRRPRACCTVCSKSVPATSIISGSPLPYSFSETNHVKGRSHRRHGWRTVPSPLGKSLSRGGATCAASAGRCRKLLEQGARLKRLGDNARLDVSRSYVDGFGSRH